MVTKITSILVRVCWGGYYCIHNTYGCLTCEQSVYVGEGEYVWLTRVLFSAIAGNIPQKTVARIEAVGEGSCGATESFFPDRYVLYKYHTLQECRLSEGTQVKSWVALPLLVLLTFFHCHIWYLLNVFEKEMQLWRDVVQWKNKAAFEQQRRASSVRMHRPWGEVIEWKINRLQSSGYLYENKGANGILIFIQYRFGMSGFWYHCLK